MASPVDTTVKHFLSTMNNAPVLNGTAGALVSLLDALLVTGFDPKTASTLTVLDGIATLEFTGSHAAALDSVILVEGATPSTLNGEQKVVGVEAGKVRFATAAANGAASGSISFKMAPAGWAKAFTGTNVAAYKSLHPEAHSGGMYLRVSDTSTTSARVVAYEAMSDIDTGAGPFPTTAQVSGGGYWTKSTVASATAVKWALFADGRTVYLHVTPGAATNAAYGHGATRGFGDLIAERPAGDAFATFLNSSSTATVASQYLGALDCPTSASDPTLVMARAYTGLGTSEQGTSRPFLGTEVALSGADAVCGSFPNPINGALMLSRRYCTSETSGKAPRAIFPGLHTCPQSGLFNSLSLFTVVPGALELEGRRLMTVNPANVAFTSAASAATAGASFFDITGPWR